MESIHDSLETRPGGAVFRSNGLALSELAALLDTHQQLEALGTAAGLNAAEVLAGLITLGLGPEGSAGPTLIRKPPAQPRWDAILGEPSIASILPGSSRPDRLALAAALLQIHDFWDAGHHAAQAADDLGPHPIAAYWHGIAHRREPDPGNAAYWFRRVGRHPLFEPLGAAVQTLPASQGAPANSLVRNGAWDPFAFVEYCSNARPGSPSEAFARQVQRLEMRMLAEFTTRAVLNPSQAQILPV